MVGIMRATDFRYLGKLFQLGAFAHVDDEGGAANLARLHGQVGKLRDELDRQVVDAVVAEVLEGFQHRGLPRTAHAGDDDQFRRGLPADAGGPCICASTFFRIGRGGLTGLHELDSSIRARRSFRSCVIAK